MLHKNLLLFLVALTLGIELSAQIPKYRFSKFDSTQQATTSQAFTADNYGGKWQSIYYPTNFPGMPAGKIAAIYIRVGDNVFGVSSVTYPFFTAKIGYTNDSTFPNGSNKWDTFKKGLTTIYGPANFTASSIDTIGKWVRIPVTTGSFSFSPESKFVVEIAMGPKSNGGQGFDIMSSNRGTVVGKQRTMGAQRDSMRVFNNTWFQIIDLGFDMATTGIEGVKNVTSFGLFPNPAIDGKFNISMEARQPVETIDVLVSNTIGQTVWTKKFTTSDKRIFEQIDLGDLAKGTYLVTINAGGDVLTRKLLIE